MASKKGKEPAKKVFVGLEAVLDELDRLSDTDSDASYDSVREAAFLEGEDPDVDNLSSSDEDWLPHKRARQPSPSGLHTPCTPGPSPSPTTSAATPTTPTSGQRRARGRGRSRARGRAASARSPSLEASSDEERWMGISDDDEDPAMINFSPQRPPGPQLVTGALYSPLQLFQLYFTTSAIDTIIRNTNDYAQKRSEDGKKFPWTPLSAKDFMTFLGIIIYMGLISAKTVVDYWARKVIYNFPFPSFAMSRSRFQAISWNLHLSNMKDDEENLRKKGTPGFDKLCKIKPLYTEIVSSCKAYFHPQRQLAVDERMVASKARIALKQYMKDKPTKWGYKLFVLADSLCGYTWNFYVYEGKSSTNTGKGLSYESVMNLMDFRLLGKGYQVFTDNFYTSPALYMDLLHNHTQACGTIPPNRQGFPKTKLNDLTKKSKRGDIRWIRNGKVLFVKWMDTREVTLCSTIHKSYQGDTVSRQMKSAEGVWSRSQISVPAAVVDYNRYMGGVDLSDALIGYYNVLHKTKKWYKTFFFHFIDIAVVNSFILHSELSKSQNKTPLTQKLFREQLISELVGEAPTTSAAGASTSAAGASPPQMCLPEYFGGDATAGRKTCALCRKEKRTCKTPVFCVKCNVALCLVANRNCFKRWHSEGHV